MRTPPPERSGKGFARQIVNPPSLNGVTNKKAPTWWYGAFADLRHRVPKTCGSDYLAVEAPAAAAAAASAAALAASPVGAEAASDAGAVMAGAAASEAAGVTTGAGAGAGASTGAGAGAGAAASSFLPQAARATEATRAARTREFFISVFPIGQTDLELPPLAPSCSVLSGGAWRSGAPFLLQPQIIGRFRQYRLTLTGRFVSLQ